MVERSNKKNVDEQTLASFKISQELWQRFQARCIEDQTTTAEVLSQLIADYLDEMGESSVKSLDKLINQIIRETVEQYLQQNLETQVLKTVENRLNELIENCIEHQLQSNRSQAPETPSPQETQPTPPQQKNQPTTLKTAKELGDILGVSAPYITTLNRIGELQQRGWEDSGKRRGKTILYKPID
ncbi:MAG: hypothetical protein VKK42_22095 [Lyngbya sp.]|nr:hypothetical protein [Lyngbya sp.]